MKALVVLSFVAGLAACSSTAERVSPTMAEQQVLEGARAGNQLPDGSETYTDGQRVGGDNR